MTDTIFFGLFDLKLASPNKDTYFGTMRHSMLFHTNWDFSLNAVTSDKIFDSNFCKFDVVYLATLVNIKLTSDYLYRTLSP